MMSALQDRPGRSPATFLEIAAATIIGAAGAIVGVMTMVGSPVGLPSYVIGVVFGLLLAIFAVVLALAFGFAWARLALAGFLWTSLAAQMWTLSVALAGGGLQRAMVVGFATITAAGAVNLHRQSVRSWVASAGDMRRQRFPPGSGWGLTSGVLAIFAGAGVWTQLGHDAWRALGQPGSVPRFEPQVFGAMGIALALFALATLKHSRSRLYLVLALDLAVVVGHLAVDLGRAGPQLALDLTLVVLIVSAYFAASRPGLKSYLDAIANRSNISNRSNGPTSPHHKR